MIEGLAKIIQRIGDGVFVIKVDVKAEDRSWIGFDVTPVPLTRDHLYVITATDQGDRLSPNYDRSAHGGVVARRLVFSPENAQEKAFARVRDIIDTVRARRSIFNIPLPAGTWPKPDELPRED